MSKIERVKELLDERGVKWWEGPWPWPSVIYDGACGVRYEVSEFLDRLRVKTLLPVEPGQAVETTFGPTIDGNTSDGYHTFDELYDHRTGLLMALCNTWAALLRSERWSADLIAKDGVFKSRRHDDGSMFDGMFIVGVNCTSEGHKWATWHCEDKWWDLFFIPELEIAPKWDGHTPAEALERLLDAFTSRKVEK